MSQEAAVPPGFWEEVQRRIDLAVGQALRSAPLRNATITGGGLTIQDGTLRILYPESQGGGVAVYYGNLFSGGSYVGTGMLVQAPDGGDIASFSWDSTTDRQTAHLHDALNNTVVSNDVVGGQGLGRPYLPVPFYPARTTDMTVSSVSGTFETLWQAVVYKQHPRLYVAAAAFMDTAGTTGELQVLVNGVPLGTTQSVTATAASFGFLGAVAGAHMSSLLVQVQGRRTSVSGALKVVPSISYGLES